MPAVYVADRTNTVTRVPVNPGGAPVANTLAGTAIVPMLVAVDSIGNVGVTVAVSTMPPGGASVTTGDSPILQNGDPAYVLNPFIGTQDVYLGRVYFHDGCCVSCPTNPPLICCLS